MILQDLLVDGAKVRAAIVIGTIADVAEPQVALRGRPTEQTAVDAAAHDYHGLSVANDGENAGEELVITLAELENED